MTDTATAGIRARADWTGRSSKGVSDDIHALLDALDRSRAELAGRRAGEEWLSEMRQRVINVGDHWEIGVSTFQVEQFLAHIDHLEGVVHDLLSEDAAATLRQQGAAEERARIKAILGNEEYVRWVMASGCSVPGAMGFVRDRIGELPPLPDLLPPAEARLALDCERAKVAALRAACERIANLMTSLRPFGAANDMRDIARAALEATA